MLVASAARGSAGWIARPGTALLLAVALVLAVFRAGAPLHLHHSASAGLYNEAHVLAALESITGDAPVPAAAPAALFDHTAATAQPFAGAAPPAPVAPHADPRAPPAASPPPPSR
jgi:hypothetical protein